MKYFKLFFSLSFCFLFSKVLGRSLADLRVQADRPAFEGVMDKDVSPVLRERNMETERVPVVEARLPQEEFRPRPIENERQPKPNEFERKAEEMRGPESFDRGPQEFRSPEMMRAEIRPEIMREPEFGRSPERERVPEFDRISEFEKRTEVEERSEASTRMAGVKEKVAVEEAVAQIESEDEGNWLLKKVWWERAQELFEKLLYLNNQITTLQVSIIKNREQSSKSVENLFKSVGKEQEKIRSELNYLINLITTSKNEELLEDFSDQEKAVLNKIVLNEIDFNKMIELFDEIENREDLLSKSIIQLNQLVEECKNYEKHSWLNLKEIGQILNDEKAKQLYYGIDADFKNVEALLNYIKIELKTFIRESESAIQENSSSIIQKINEFEDKDLSLDKMITQYKHAWQERQKTKEASDKKKKEILSKKKIKSSDGGIVGETLNWFRSWF